MIKFFSVRGLDLRVLWWRCMIMLLLY